jgi:hypothetical protein
MTIGPSPLTSDHIISICRLDNYPPSISQLPGDGNEVLLCLKFGIALPDRTFETNLKPWVGQNCNKYGACADKLERISAGLNRDSAAGLDG